MGGQDKDLPGNCVWCGHCTKWRMFVYAEKERRWGACWLWCWQWWREVARKPEIVSASPVENKRVHLSLIFPSPAQHGFGTHSFSVFLFLQRLWCASLVQTGVFFSYWNNNLNDLCGLCSLGLYGPDQGSPQVSHWSALVWDRDPVLQYWSASPLSALNATLPHCKCVRVKAAFSFQMVK